MSNPNPKHGFKANPQNINKDGRPPKGYSITEMMRNMLSSDPEVKQSLGKVIIAKALEGDTTAIKTVWQYMDGMPMQPIKHSGDEDNPIKLVIEDYTENNE